MFKCSKAKQIEDIKIASKYSEDTGCELLIDSSLHDEFNMTKHTGLNVRDIVSLRDDLCILVVNKERSYDKYAAVNNLSLWSEDELQQDDYAYYIGERLFCDKLRKVPRKGENENEKRKFLGIAADCCLFGCISGPWLDI